MKRKQRIGVITLGCSKNTVDSERLMNQIVLNDYDISDPNHADTIIINTCGFIEAAKEESINSILNAVELKKQGKIKKVIVSGCLSQRYKEDLIKEIPEVDSWFGTENYEGIIKEIGGELKYELLGERYITTPGHYAYLKISEGCNNPCSFCAIPIMRGKHKSKTIEELMNEARFLASNGTKELIIIGQDTTDYGIDIYKKRNLAELLNRLSELNKIEWIRLLYAYPTHFPQDVITALNDNPKLCKYLDLPLQHISDPVLKSMRRGITSRRSKELIESIKKGVPGLTLRTTFIVGYPGERDKDFTELCDFIKQYEFDRIGVFTYSAEENTSAFDMGDPIPAEIKEERKSALMEIQKEISEKKNKSLVGHNMRVVIDGFEGERSTGYYVGRSHRDAPEVDGEVLIPADHRLLTGHFYYVTIYDYNEYDLFGRLK